MEGPSSDHLDATLRKVHEKPPVPEIDFSLHTMEDGTQVSTQERVCKGIVASFTIDFHVLMLRIRVPGACI